MFDTMSECETALNVHYFSAGGLLIMLRKTVLTVGCIVFFKIRHPTLVFCFEKKISPSCGPGAGSIWCSSAAASW